MRRVGFLAAFALLIGLVLGGPAAWSYPPGSITPGQLGESDVTGLIAQALKDDIRYAESIYSDTGGYFGSGALNERGVRTSADYALTYAFLYSHFPDATFGGVPRETVRDHAITAIRYGYRTHRSSGGQWGYSFETSLWAQGFGMAAWLIWDELPGDDRQGVEAMITGEADHNAARIPPTNEFGDTKSEENAWDTNVLALAPAMFPADSRAASWDNKLKEFAMNSFSLAADEDDQSVVDGRTVADWVHGPNVHPDLTLENHDLFHPTYQAAPIWLLTESAVFYARWPAGPRRSAAPRARRLGPGDEKART